MINQTHIVIDLETMGIGTNAAIVAIGAVRIERGQHTGEFYRIVDLASSIAHGGTTDASTINWWLKQSPEARAEVDGSQHPAELIDVLLSLSDFIQARHETRLWGNGATFDLRILGEAYDACHLSHPWDFRLERDLRTILELHPDAKQVGEFFGIRHHALADACHEAKQLCKALRLHADIVKAPHQATAGGRNPLYEGLFEGETEDERCERLRLATLGKEVSHG